MLNKKGALNKILLFSIGLLFFIGLVNVIAEPPGIINNQQITDTAEGVTNIAFYANITTDPWLYSTNVTLFVNVSSDGADVNKGALQENTTLDLTNANGTSLFAQLVETIEFDLTDFLAGGQADGFYAHYSYYACGNNVTDWPIGDVNSTECAWSDNSSIYMNPVNFPARTAPTVDVISPLSGNDDDGLVTFNISMTATDTQTLEGGNLTLLLNTSGSGDGHGCGDSSSLCAPNSNVTYNFNETIDLTTTQTFFSVTFNETGLFGGAFTDNTTIYYSAYGCTNASGPGNCSYATGNFTLTLSYFEAETTAPTFSNVTVNNVGANNGTILTTNTMNIAVDVLDNGIFQNVTLFLNATNVTVQPVDQNNGAISWVENDTITVGAVSQNRVSFNLSNAISNETWFDSETQQAYPSDGFISFYLLGYDNESSAVYSENYTYILDTTAPVISNQLNFTQTNACDTGTVNFATDEASNATGYYYQLSSGEANNVSFTDITTKATNLTLNMTGLVSNTQYYYNISTCDANGNCGTDNVQGDYTFDWALCEGWSHYGILTSTLSMSGIANETVSDFVSVWNATRQGFDTFTTASPALGNDAHVVIRGQGVLINVGSDTTWTRTYDGNVSFGEGMDVNLSSGWNVFGLIEDRTPENITYGQTPSFSQSGTLGNITFVSSYNNNKSESVYRDYILGRTTNANMTSSMRAGYAPWLYTNVSKQWINRTAVED